MTTMLDSSTSTNHSSPHDADQVIRLHGVTWDEYESMLAIRGERSGVRMAYWHGELELMAPSRGHEDHKTRLGRLIETYAEEVDLYCNGYGSWTIKERLAKCGVEPDECYVFTPGHEELDRPDLAIEVVWTSGGIGKLQIYSGLGVPEVWFWRSGGIEVHALREATQPKARHYVKVDRSEALPNLDLDVLATYAERSNQTEAVRAYRRSLQANR